MRIPSVNKPVVRIPGVKKTSFTRSSGVKNAKPISIKGRTRKPKKVRL